MDFHGSLIDLRGAMKVRVVEMQLVGDEWRLQRPPGVSDSTVGLLSFGRGMDAGGTEFEGLFLDGVINRAPLLEPLRQPRIVSVMPGAAFAFRDAEEGSGSRLWVAYPMEASGLVVE